MAWTRPQHSKSRVDSCGALIASPLEIHIFEVDEVFAVVNNWRSSHGFPLQVIKMTLRKRAKKLDEESIIAQRIKRIPAITLKLSNNPNMKLSKMHDIGGCRAVLRDVQTVEELTDVYSKATAKNRLRGGEFVKKYDYIAEPKPDGYRGIHLVFKYRTDSPRRLVYNGLRIEIQIRSQLQHAWATAVETVDTFTGQALKSNIGEVSWLRFFALMSSAIADLEKRPKVPNTPSDAGELKAELRSFSHHIALLEGLTRASENIQNKTGDVFLLRLNSKERQILVDSYKMADLPHAEQAYLSFEKEAKGKPEMQSVLVSVDSFAALRKAYPNYFLDISAFMNTLRHVVS
jgi:ppGpp synthetase/RelA/SpoT-type nucleotidyltranferase